MNMNSHPTPFTAEDDDLIRSMTADGFADVEIGERLGRSRYAIESRRHKIGCKRPRVSTAAFTPEQDDIIREMFLAGRNDHDIGKAIGRSEYSVESRRSRNLGLRRVREVGAPVAPFEPYNDERPLGEPFRTRSGLIAIRLASGVIAYTPSIHGELGGPRSSPS
jgi:hypothetical protein